MKKLLLLLLIIPVLACGQTTPYADLPTLSTLSGTDGLTMVRGGEPYKMTATTFNKTLTDSIAAHLSRIVLLEASSGSTDSSWNSITVDTSVFIGNSEIHAATDDQFHIKVNSEDVLNIYDNLVTIEGDVLPVMQKTYNNGDKDSMWDTTFTDVLVIDNDSMSINATGEGADKEFQFHDPKNGDYTASEMLAGGGSSYTAGDGLSLDGTEFNLGGPGGSPATITSDTYIQNTGAYLAFMNNVNSGSYYNSIILGDGFVSLQSGTGYVSGSRARFMVNGAGSDPYYGTATMEMCTQLSATLFGIEFDGSAETALVNDNRSTTVGLQYGGDYSADFTNRSLVDKEYVDDAIADGGGGSSGDTVSADQYIHLLSDTTSFTFGFGLGLAGDTAGCVDGAILGAFPNQQDTLVALVIDDAIAKKTNASVNVRILYDVNPYDATPTVIWSGTVTTTASSSTTFTTKKIPPNTHIWAEINGTPTNKATHIYLPFEFAKISQ